MHRDPQMHLWDTKTQISAISSYFIGSACNTNSHGPNNLFDCLVLVRIFNELAIGVVTAFCLLDSVVVRFCRSHMYTPGIQLHTKQQYCDLRSLIKPRLFFSAIITGLTPLEPARYNALDETSAREGAAGEKKKEGPEDASSVPTLTVTKFASVRGLSAYFCRDQGCYR